MDTHHQPEDYMASFDIKQFLNTFPDPFDYFLDKDRKCEFNIKALECLKKRYRYQSVKRIAHIYNEFNFNFARTCELLDKTPRTRKTKRLSRELKVSFSPEQNNLMFFHESFFIEQKNEIMIHIENRERQRSAGDQVNEAGLECGCCYEALRFEESAACPEGDLFCRPCVLKNVEVRSGEGHITFPCLVDCGAHFPLHLLEKLMEEKAFTRLLHRTQLAEVRAAGIVGLEVCPFCEYAAILPPNMPVFSCLNPECLKTSCRKCQKENHLPLRCEEVETDEQTRARKYIEDEMTKALIRSCYRCGKKFIKTDGCNKTTCSCGAIMCYICRKPVSDYKHFNGQGGTEYEKCPLFSSEKVLHVEPVRAVAQKALQSVRSTNPDLQLKHDPTLILSPVATGSADAALMPPGMQEQPNRLINDLAARFENVFHRV